MIGLYIGRFQPLHNGHAEYMKRILSECDSLVVVIGSSQEKDTMRNPLSYSERKKMLSDFIVKGFPGRKIKIVPVKDYISNEEWMSKVVKAAGKFDVVYAGENKVVKKIFRDAQIKVKTIRRLRNVSGTKIRQRIAKMKEWEELVPEGVYLYLRKISSEKRIREYLQKNK